MTTDLVRKLNQELTKDIVLPAITEQLGQDFPVKIRKLTGKALHLFSDIPKDIAQAAPTDNDQSVSIALNNMPWLKKIIIASVVSPKLTEKSIGEHNEDELSVDALEGDMYFMVTEILGLSGLLKDQEEAVATADAFPKS